ESAVLVHGGTQREAVHHRLRPMDRPPTDPRRGHDPATARRRPGPARHPRSPRRRRHHPGSLRIDLASRPRGRHRRVPDRPTLRTAAGPLTGLTHQEATVTSRAEPTDTHPTTMRNHWYWRPGWRPGRHFYTWHLTFDHAHDLHALVDTYQRRLADLPGLDLIPRPWLHLTLQGVGFVDEVTEQDARRIAQAAAAHLATLPAPELTFHQPAI